MIGNHLSIDGMLRLRDQGGHGIVAALLERRGYDRAFAHALLDHACDREADWADRRRAVLALENQLLSLEPAATDELIPFLTRLGFTPAPGASCSADVLKQGYSTVEPRSFVGELTRRLSRLAPVHESLRRAGAEPDAIANFEHAASQESLLTLGRAAFGPEEVVSRVLRLARLTAAEIQPVRDNPQIKEEADAAVDRLPEYETDILNRILGMARAWWTGPATPAMVNGLVENPVGTLALVIRPPGSSVELEIKRIGLPGPHPLSVLFERRGIEVPPPHRLQGGTTLSVLRWEAANSALLSGLFRRIHGKPAPIACMMQVRLIKAVPCAGGGEAPLAAWFGDPASFGTGFAAMRRAMRRSLFAFAEETGVRARVPRSPEALTRAFLACMTPAQCVLVGTSAFRLDKVGAWLCGGGPDSYFKAAHCRPPTPGEAYRFADTILTEILGTYRPPAFTGSYGGYVAAAFADPANRAAADRAFRAAAAAMGRLWGTLLGLRGYTDGECFVPRNVGLRAVWAEGAWQTQIVFMDHELTNIIGKRLRRFHPRTALPGMHKDWVHILGGELGGRLWPGSVAVLADIYRVDAAAAAKGRASVIEEMRRAYRAALGRLRSDTEVRSHFRRSFVDPLLAWDAVVGLYRASRVGARHRSQWKGRMRRVMLAHGLEEPLIHEYRRAIRRHGWLLRRCPYLFDADDGA